MIKEGAEDWKRHKSDREVNNRAVPVLRADGQETPTLWKDVAVGSIVLVLNREEVPADLIVLQTSEPKAVCYVETSNIDGETNLKLKEAVVAASELIGGLPGPEGKHEHGGDLAAAASGLTGEAVYDLPNDRIHNFTGKMRLTGASGADSGDVPVGARNVVLRGCTLRNTRWMLGLVVYTGRDTKVMKKAGGVRSKISQVEQTMNTCILIVFAAQALLCLVTDIALWRWQVAHPDDAPYLENDSYNATLVVPWWFGQFLSFLLLYNNFIPISLYVTGEGMRGHCCNSYRVSPEEPA